MFGAPPSEPLSGACHDGVWDPKVLQAMVNMVEADLDSGRKEVRGGGGGAVHGMTGYCMWLLQCKGENCSYCMCQWEDKITSVWLKVWGKETCSHC